MTIRAWRTDGDAAVTAAPTDWDGMQAFLAVALRGSVALGATHLGVNHSTILRRLARLEAALGTRLFDRLPDGYALTAAGNSLAAHLQDLPELVEDAQRLAIGGKTEIRGPIRLGASDVVVESLLLPALASFRRRHPRVDISLTSNYAFTPLSADDVDIAVRGADTAPEHLQAHRIGEFETAAYASRAYLAAHRARALDEHRWVALVASPAFERMHRWLQAQVPAERIVLRVDSLVGLADAVAAGLGVGLLPAALARGRRDLVLVARPGRTLNKPIWVLMSADLQRISRMRALYDHLVRTLARSPALAAAARKGPV